MKKTISPAKKSKNHIDGQSLTEDISNILRNSGLRITPQRIAMLEELEFSTVGLSIKELYKILKQKKIKIDEASVYRTIEALRDLDLVHSLPESKYKLCSHVSCDQNFHLSLICKICSEVLEPHLDKSNESLITSSLSLNPGQIQNLQVHYICQSCQNSK